MGPAKVREPHWLQKRPELATGQTAPARAASPPRKPNERYDPADNGQPSNRFTRKIRRRRTSRADNRGRKYIKPRNSRKAWRASFHNAGTNAESNHPLSVKYTPKRLNLFRRQSRRARYDFVRRVWRHRGPNRPPQQLGKFVAAFASKPQDQNLTSRKRVSFRIEKSWRRIVHVAGRSWAHVFALHMSHHHDELFAAIRPQMSDARVVPARLRKIFAAPNRGIVPVVSFTFLKESRSAARPQRIAMPLGAPDLALRPFFDCPPIRQALSGSPCVRLPAATDFSLDVPLQADDAPPDFLFARSIRRIERLGQVIVRTAANPLTIMSLSEMSEKNDVCVCEFSAANPFAEFHARHVGIIQSVTTISGVV